MEIRYVHEFVVLAEALNYSKASELLFISKSSLSKHIIALEREVGGELFDRTSRQIVLTSFGKAFFEHAKRLDRDWTAMRTELTGLEKGTFNLGLFPLLPIYGFTDVINLFKETFPACRLNLIEGEADEIREMVADGRCQAGMILTGEEKKDELFEEIVDHDELIALVPEKSSLGEKGILSVTELKEKPLLLLQEGTYACQSIIEACRKEGFEPKIAYQSKYGGTLRDMVLKGMGIAFFNGGCAIRPGNKGMKLLRLSPSIPITIRMIAQRENRDFRVEWLKRTLCTEKWGIKEKENGNENF